MANEWNVSYPLDHTLISDAPGEIRKLKDSCKDQLKHEHEDPVDGDATGSEHSSGSAVGYEGTSTPSDRPGGVALADNAVDRGRVWFDDNFDPPPMKRWNGSTFETLGYLSAYTDEDSNGDAMLKNHAYKAATAGMVSVTNDLTGNDQSVKGYVGSTNDPAGAGTMIAAEETGSQGPSWHSFSFLVSKNEYFEITSSAGTLSILWKSIGVLSKPVDQE